MWWRKQYDHSETIFALASGSLPCAVAIVRLSGPEAFKISSKLCPESKFSDRSLCTLLDEKGKKIDRALVLAFKAPHSFTGEDVLEFQCHGSIAVVEKLQQRLVQLGARHAEKGEFSYRAFQNEKLKLDDLEEMVDVYAATELTDLSSIYKRADGSLEKQFGLIRERVIELQAILDTAVDFSEEYASAHKAAHAKIQEAIHECSVAIQRFDHFREAREVPRIVLAGRPNAGKSSLFNALLCRHRAIVTPKPGTTRDVVEEDLLVGERHWKLVDTAGIRETDEAIEREGIELATQYFSSSNMWILVVDGHFGMGEAENSLIQRFGERPHLIVWNKQDESPLPGALVGRALPVSATTGVGLDRLWEKLSELADRAYSEQDRSALPSYSQTVKLRRAYGEMQAFVSLLKADTPPEVLGEKNRYIIQVLESVFGEVDPEEVLGQVFSQFCIGK